MIATQPDTSVWCHPTMICGSSALLGAIVLRSELASLAGGKQRRWLLLGGEGC